MKPHHAIRLPLRLPFILMSYFGGVLPGCGTNKQSKAKRCLQSLPAEALRAGLSSPAALVLLNRVVSEADGINGLETETP